MKALGQQRAGLGFLSGRMTRGTLGILSQRMGGKAKEVRCQVGLGSGGLRSFYSPGAKRDMLWMVLNWRRGGGTPLVSQG